MEIRATAPAEATLMGDWKTLLGSPKFRDLWLALLCANLGSWSVLTALPILVAERFGAGGALVLSLGWRILPKILLAPVCGILLRRFGAPRVTCIALLVEALLTAALPWCQSFVVLQIVIAGIGAMDAFMMPGLLSLRGTATPNGLEMAGNSLCSMAERLGKTVGPPIAGLAVIAGFAPAFLGFGVLIALASAAVFRLPRALPEIPSHGSSLLRLPLEFWRTIRGERALLGMLVLAASYMVMLGGLRPFLFWANRDWFGGTDNAWTGLMTAQGAGAMIGAVVAGSCNRALLRRASAYTLTMTFGLIESVLHICLLLCPFGPAGAWLAMGILALSGIPETISTAAWFTALQQRLSPNQQGVFFAFSSPVLDISYILGVFFAGAHAGGMLQLAPWWAILSLIATLPIVPFMIVNARRPRPAEASI